MQGVEENEKKIKIVAHCMLDYPSKPTRYEFYFHGSKKQEDIVSKLVEETGNSANTFTLNYRVPGVSKKVDPSKSFAEQSIERIVLDVIPVNAVNDVTDSILI